MQIRKLENQLMPLVRGLMSHDSLSEELRYKSYVMRRGQFIFAKTKYNRLIRVKCLLGKLKYQPLENLWIFADQEMTHVYAKTVRIF